MKTKKTTSKPITKKTVKPIIPVAEIIPPLEPTPKQGNKNLFLGIALTIVVVFGLYLYFQNQIIVATVNGKPITRLTLMRELEKQGGKKVLDNMIITMLIEEDANKQNISISKETVDKEIKTIEDNVKKQNQTLDKLLAAQDMTRNDLYKQIQTQKLVEKLAVKKTSVTSKEVDDYITKNKDAFPETADMTEIKASVKNQLEQELSGKQIDEYIKMIRAKAQVRYLLNFN